LAKTPMPKAKPVSKMPAKAAAPMKPVAKPAKAAPKKAAAPRAKKPEVMPASEPMPVPSNETLN
jgi:histone H1/5